MGRTRGVSVAIAVAIGGVVALTVSLLLATGAWDLVRIPQAPVSFVDLRSVTTAADCVAANPNWSVASQECTTRPEYLAEYNYPTVWAVVFDAVGLREAATDAVGWAMALLYSVTCAGLAYVTLRSSRGRLQVVVLLAVFLSPPALLLIERGNVDGLVYAGVTAAGLAYVWRWRRTAAVLLAFATIAKLFPLGGFLLLLSDRTRRTSVIALYAAVTGLGLVFIAPELQRIAASTPQIPGDSFGAATLPLWGVHEFGLAVDWRGPGPRLAGILIFAVALAVLALWFRRRPTGRIARAADALTSQIVFDRTTCILFLTGAGTFLAAYLVGVSFDYRLVFLAPAIAALNRLRGRSALALMGLLVLMLYVSVNVPGYIQAVGDIVLALLAPLLAWLTLRIASTVLRNRASPPGGRGPGLLARVTAR